MSQGGSDRRHGSDRRSASWWRDSGAAEKCAASRVTYAQYYERSVGDADLAKLCDFPTLAHDVPRTTWELQSMRELSHGAEREDAPEEMAALPSPGPLPVAPYRFHDPHDPHVA